MGKKEIKYRVALEQEFIITNGIRDYLAGRNKSEEEDIEYARLLDREAELKKLLDD